MQLGARLFGSFAGLEAGDCGDEIGIFAGERVRDKIHIDKTTGKEKHAADVVMRRGTGKAAHDDGSWRSQGAWI